MKQHKANNLTAIQANKYLSEQPLPNLDLVTLSTLLEQRGAEALSLHKEQLPLLREFLSNNHQGTSDLFQQEKQRLEMIVEGIAL